MNRSGLKFATVIVVAFMAVVPFLGFDDLPRQTRAAVSIANGPGGAVCRDTSLKHAKSEVAGELQSEAELFRTIPAARQWPATLDGAATTLQSAERDMQRLNALQKREPAARIVAKPKRLLADERRLRSLATEPKLWPQRTRRRTGWI